MSGCDCRIEARDRTQRRALVPLLAINGLMFVVELAAGIAGQSTGLIADSLDMLADATVYGLSLYAVGKPPQAKARAARLSGVFQMLLALGVIADVLRRFVFGSEPLSKWMVGMGLLALGANMLCLLLIARHRHGEIHMRASWIFSRNDVIANLGVIAAGLLVAWLSSPLPDLVIGLGIAVLVLNGGIRIVRDANSALADLPTRPAA